MRLFKLNEGITWIEMQVQRNNGGKRDSHNVRELITMRCFHLFWNTLQPGQFWPWLPKNIWNWKSWCENRFLAWTASETDSYDCWKDSLWPQAIPSCMQWLARVTYPNLAKAMSLINRKSGT